MKDVNEIISDENEKPEKRAKALLSLMTLKEKVGQLNQHLYGFNIFKRKGDEFELTEEFQKEVDEFGGIGVLYGLYRADPWSGKTAENGITAELAPRAYNTVQHYVMEHSRLHIPMLVSTECPHGHQALDSGLLPVNLATGATFDGELCRKAFKACGRQLKDMNADLALMSVLDVCRDPRWGRSEECFSEDPYLCSVMAENAIKGMRSSGVATVAKHLCAQGETTGGINASAALIGERELREIHLPPVKAAVKAGTDAVMAAYNEIDGVYCHANDRLLNGILRNEYGFQGFVMADGCAVDALTGMTGDTEKSAALALSSGVDVSLWDKAFTTLAEACERGLVSERAIDRAVLRVLTLKFKRGLFEKPYIEKKVNKAEYYDIHNLSERMAEESVVCLKNSGILPLKKCKVLVTGPNAHDIYRQSGDYTPPIDKGSSRTVLEGLREYLGENNTVYAPGCGLFEADEKMCAEAVKKASECDVIIAVMGGSSSRYESVRYDTNGAALKDDRISMDCGEGRDVADLRLPKAQTAFVRELKKCGKPVVTVVISGRPYGIGEVAAESDALLQCFYPGPYGGKALGRVIFGECDVTGRLPVSVPESSESLPCYYNSKNSYGKESYADEKGKVLYGFGAGLSYTEFEFKDIEVCKDRIVFKVKNTGKRHGTTVPMLFLKNRETEATARVSELKWFKRLSLEAGEEEEVSAKLDRDTFKTYDRNMRFVTEPGVTEWTLKDGDRIIAQGNVARR
ncbi:MAG: glycoside hydrolase family 3 C-terminal domain-containing protein [Lachnospiraceae bacterium]|nr:glycoside hydrolase family 3 C-terminal domain-containing protein [Lachnospiraceae bacterium]